MNTLKTGAIVEYGLTVGTIIEQDGEQHFQYAIYDHKPCDGIDKVSELCVEDMVVIGHIDTDSELLEVDNINYNDVW